MLAKGLASPTGWWAALIVALVLAATHASAQVSNQPAVSEPLIVAPAATVVESKELPPVRASVPLKPTPAATQPVQARKPGGEGPATWRIVAALAVVLGAIFVVRWFGRRVIAGPTSGRGTRAVQVISRTIVSPKQQLMLVQVGRRLVLVGNSGSSMSSLCEISEGEEVTELLGQVQGEKSESISRAFGNLFRREEEKYEEPAEAKSQDRFPDEIDRDIDPDVPMGTSREELNELLNKVRDMKSQFRR